MKSGAPSSASGAGGSPSTSAGSSTSAGNGGQSGRQSGLPMLLFSLNSETVVIQGHRAPFGPGTQAQHGTLKEET